MSATGVPEVTPGVPEVVPDVPEVVPDVPEVAPVFSGTRRRVLRILRVRFVASGLFRG